MEGIKAIPLIALSLLIAGLVASAALVTTGEFGDSMDQPCWNASWTLNQDTRLCVNNTDGTLGYAGSDSLNMSNAYYGVYQADQGNASVANQLTTVGVVAVMVIIVGLLAGLFVYFRWFR